MSREENSDAFVKGPCVPRFQDGPGEAEAYGFVGWVTSAVACGKHRFGTCRVDFSFPRKLGEHQMTV